MRNRQAERRRERDRETDRQRDRQSPDNLGIYRSCALHKVRNEGAGGHPDSPREEGESRLAGACQASPRTHRIHLFNSPGTSDQQVVWIGEGQGPDWG